MNYPFLWCWKYCLAKTCTMFFQNQSGSKIKIHKNSLQSHEISKGYSCWVSLQKGHLKVTTKRKSTYKISVSAWFSMWTSLGLNQGPPDYESVALTNWATSPEFHEFGCKDNEINGKRRMELKESCGFNTFWEVVDSVCGGF